MRKPRILSQRAKQQGKKPEQIVPDREDLDLAWARAKLDRPDRCFVTYPYLLTWVETDLKGWLDRLQTRIDGGYSPSACQVCYEPKPKWMVRPGAVIELNDEIMFNAILGHFHPQIWNTIGWSQGDPDVANQFQKSPLGPPGFTRTSGFGMNGEKSRYVS